jgi:DNA-binding response OmpR family regulator
MECNLTQTEFGRDSALRKVLIVEDETDLGRLMSAVLEDEGYDVAVHTTGDCLDVIRSFQPDVIVCDYMLPRRSGRFVLEHVRRDLSTQVHFIMISAIPQVMERWRDWGADMFLAKPFDLEALVTSVDAFTQGAGS